MHTVFILCFKMAQGRAHKGGQGEWRAKEKPCIRGILARFFHFDPAKRKKMKLETWFQQSALAGVLLALGARWR